jgi:hypothetical protein
MWGVNLGDGRSIMFGKMGLDFGSSPIKCSQLYGSVKAGSVDYHIRYVFWEMQEVKGGQLNYWVK